MQAPPPLQVGGQELTPFVHSPRRLAVLALPGTSVAYHTDRIRPAQVLMHRMSYVNGLLIQSRGFVQNPACTRCQRGLGPFPECLRVLGHFSGCCGNCKWPDFCARCRFPTVIDLDPSESQDDDGDDEDEKAAVRQHDSSRAIEGPGVAADYPILIE